jgi:hypothetical protein
VGQTLSWEGGRAALEVRPRYVHAQLEGRFGRAADVALYLAWIGDAMAQGEVRRVLEDARNMPSRELAEAAEVREERWRWAFGSPALLQVAYVLPSDAAVLQANLRAVLAPSRARAFTHASEAHRWLHPRTETSTTARLRPAVRRE